jgi:hypothetical protein
VGTHTRPALVHYSQQNHHIPEVRRMIHPFPTDRKSKTGHTLSTKDKLHEVTEVTKHTILPLNRAVQQSLQHEPIHHLLQ